MNGAAPPTNPKQLSVQLASELQQALGSLAEFELHRDRIGTATATQVADAVADIRRRLGRSHVYVCVVGEQKAGKSTFLNAILGYDLLGAAVRECTGTVTYIGWGERLRYLARLRSGASEDFDVLCPDEHASFAAQAAQAQARIEECERQAAVLGTEIERLQEQIPKLNATLEECRRDVEAARALASEAEGEHLREREAAGRFSAELRAVEAEIPAEYRRAGHWSGLQRGMRVFSGSAPRPEWLHHLEQVKKLAALERRVKEHSRRCVAAAAAVQAAETRAAQGAQAICNARQRLVDSQNSVAAASASRTEGEQRLAEIRESERQHQYGRLSRFVEDVKQLTDMNRRGHEVEELYLFVPSKRLPKGIVLVDTPGVNTAHEENRERAWRVIRAEADACMLLSDLGQTLSESTREFVRQVRDVVPHVLLVLTKLDAALKSAELSGGDAAREVAEAVSVGRERFAAEVGRAGQEILAFAVSARPALKDREGPAAQSFDAELSRLFAVVEAERAIAVGARCARAIQHVHRGTRDTADAAERGYQERIKSLLEQQIHDPKATCDQGIWALVPDIRQLGLEVSANMRGELQAPLATYRNQVLQRLEAAQSADQLAREIARFQEETPGLLDGIARECRGRIDAMFGPRISGLIEKARQPLRERYRISKSLASVPPHPAEMPLRMISPSSRVSLSGATANIQKKLKDYIGHNTSLGLSAGRTGASALQARDSTGLVIAGIALAVTAAMAASHARKFGTLKSQCVATMGELLDQVIQESTCEAAVGPLATEQNIGQGLTEVMYRDIADFQSWINAVIARERQALAIEQERLGHFRALRERLAGHDARLAELHSQASLVCAGLCRSGEGSRI